jgi:hypothetical protein
METITIDEFKKLKTREDKDSTQISGLFAISEKAQRGQCENLKVGDTVFYLRSSDAGISEEGVPHVDIAIIQAIVVDDVVTFKGTKLPVRNELEN